MRCGTSLPKLTMVVASLTPWIDDLSMFTYDVRPFDAPLAGLVRLPAKNFAESRLPDKGLKPLERVGAAICTAPRAS